MNRDDINLAFKLLKEINYQNIHFIYYMLTETSPLSLQPGKLRSLCKIIRLIELSSDPVLREEFLQFYLYKDIDLFEEYIYRQLYLRFE